MSRRQHLLLQQQLLSEEAAQREAMPFYDERWIGEDEDEESEEEGEEEEEESEAEEEEEDLVFDSDAADEPGLRADDEVAVERVPENRFENRLGAATPVAVGSSDDEEEEVGEDMDMYYEDGASTNGFGMASDSEFDSDEYEADGGDFEDDFDADDDMVGGVGGGPGDGGGGGGGASTRFEYPPPSGDSGADSSDGSKRGDGDNGGRRGRRGGGGNDDDEGDDDEEGDIGGTQEEEEEDNEEEDEEEKEGGGEEDESVSAKVSLNRERGLEEEEDVDIEEVDDSDLEQEDVVSSRSYFISVIYYKPYNQCSVLFFIYLYLCNTYAFICYKLNIYISIHSNYLH